MAHLFVLSFCIVLRFEGIMLMNHKMITFLQNTGNKFNNILDYNETWYLVNIVFEFIYEQKYNMNNKILYCIYAYCLLIIY